MSEGDTRILSMLCTKIQLDGWADEEGRLGHHDTATVTLSHDRGGFDVLVRGQEPTLWRIGEQYKAIVKTVQCAKTRDERVVLQWTEREFVGLHS